MVDIAANLRAVQRRIAAAAERAGRDPAEITLVAVSKTQPIESIQAGYTAGLRHLGENRVEEAAEKIGPINHWAGDQRPTWHMVGHLQSRKARRAVELFDVIHSVDSLRLAEKLSRRCAEAGKTMPILLEVNVSGEASKYGLAPDEVEAVVEGLLPLPCLELQGVMTMAPIVADPEEARPVFRALRRLRDDLAARFPSVNWQHLSMGMTDDFEVAIEEGATLVRIGRAIFGERFIP